MKPEVQALPRKARDSEAAAHLLLEGGFMQFAASRAYYAMFYAAQALLLAQGQTYRSHAAVIAAFGKAFAKTGLLDSKLHRYLIDAQDYRNLGDYGIEHPIPAEQVRQILEWVSIFLKNAEDFLRTS